MSASGYLDTHLGEPILDECPHCRLPIYQSDPRRTSAPPWDPASRLYHAGCALSAAGIFWEKQLQADLQRLRGCGYVVTVSIVRPVR